MNLIKRNLSVVLAVLFSCFCAVSLTSCNEEDEDEPVVAKDESMVKSAVLKDSTQVDMEVTFKDGVSDMFIMKVDCASEELVNKIELIIENIYDGVEYVSHTKEDKYLDAKLKAQGFTKAEVAKLFEAVLNVMDGLAESNDGNEEGDKEEVGKEEDDENAGSGDEGDFITKSVTAKDGTKTELKLTFKNGISEFFNIKADYPTVDAAIEAEADVNNGWEGVEYVSHTREGKVLDAKYEAIGMSKEEGVVYLDMMAMFIDGSWLEELEKEDWEVDFSEE